MYDRNVAVTGCTIEKTSRYDRFRENNIRMELYRIILALYDEGYCMFSCNLNTYIGLLAADTAIMLREADKCPEIHLSAVITGTRYPTDTDKVYCALYDDLIKKADSKETLSEKDSLTGACRRPYHLLLRGLFFGNAADTHVRHSLYQYPQNDIGIYSLSQVTTTFPARQSVFRLMDACS